MKKLIAIVMILALASVASAGIDLTWNSTPTGSDTYDITLDVTGETGVSYVSINSLTVDSGTLTALSSSTLPEGLAHNGMIGDPLGVGYGAYGNEFAIQGVDDSPVKDGTVLSFSYTGTASEAYVGNLASAYFAESLISGTDGVDYTFSELGMETIAIPEPMTMALLGLGGLFIRRRRA